MCMDPPRPRQYPLSAHQLSHHQRNVGAFGDAVAVTAVIAGHEIIFAEVGADGGGNRFLTDIAVRGALDETFFEQLMGVFVEAPDPAHRRVYTFENLGRQLHVGCRAFRRSCRGHGTFLPGFLHR